MRWSCQETPPREMPPRGTPADASCCRCEAAGAIAADAPARATADAEGMPGKRPLSALRPPV
eukprot:14755356-Alexandrium_andersonii.AAC.1